MIRGGKLAAPIMAAFTLLLFTAPAEAAPTANAAPDGDGASPCAASDPCSIDDALAAVDNGGEVFLAPGVYTPGFIVQLTDNIDLTGQGQVHLNFAADFGADAVHIVASSGGSVIKNLTINSLAAFSGLKMEAGEAQNVIVHSTGGAACEITGAITPSSLKGSVCHNANEANNSAILSSSAVDSTVELHEVTAVADNGTGIFVNASAPGANISVVGGNVIAQGYVVDISGFNSGYATDNTVTSEIVLANSNFDSLEFAPFGSATGATGTLPAENGNVEEPALLDDGFHQLPGSPTINAGNTFPQSFLTDIDGQDRPQGEAMDIGADEAEGIPPQTTITKKPKRSTTRRIAVFRFKSSEANSTFECKLDAKPFRSCEPGKRYRGLSRKRHTFQVRATDGFENTDPTPAKYRWKVKKN